MDIDNFDKLMLSVDGRYVTMLNLFPNDVHHLSQFWADTNYKEHSTRLNALVEHTASTLTVGVGYFSTFGKSSFMIRNLRVMTFGCHSTCLTCSKDESPLHCTACEAGRFLSLVSGRCIACSSNCSSCTSSPFECLACPTGNFLDAANKKCVAKCAAGSFGHFAGNCQPCVAACAECETSSANCTKCSSITMFAEGGSCVASCSAGNFLSGDRCLQCGTGCTVCADQNTCSNCDFGSGFLKKGKENCFY